MCGEGSDWIRAAPRPEPDEELSRPLPIEPIDALAITSLVDNSTDVLASDVGPAHRAGLLSASFPPLPTSVHRDGEVPGVPLAEHGFSMLVEVTRGDGFFRVLFDAGLTPDGLVINMRRLGLDPRDVDVVVLSHGHFDHTTGLDGFIRAVGRANLPVLIHPTSGTGVASRCRDAIPTCCPHPAAARWRTPASTSSNDPSRHSFSAAPFS